MNRIRDYCDYTRYEGSVEGWRISGAVDSRGAGGGGGDEVGTG